MSSLKAYKYRLYPTKKQREALQWVLDRARELYNAALQERRDAWHLCKVSISYNQQAAQLPEIKEIRSEYHNIHSQVLQDVLRRVEKAFKAFFWRVKAGEKAGYPRFQGYGRYESFTFPQSGFSLTEDKRVCLSKIGTIKIKMPKGKKARPPVGEMKTCTIKREGEHWSCIFTCEGEAKAEYHPSEETVGIDLGLLHFATLSTGETIENPHHLRKAEQKLACLQQVLSRKKRGSKRRRKAAQLVGKTHRHVRNSRRDFHHKEARKLVVKAGLNKSINDAGWGQFQQICESKAACAGSRILFVSPKYTSQVCSGCGAIVKKELEERWHECSCGCSLDRDYNAAINIRRIGLSGEPIRKTRQTRSRARAEPSGDAPLRSPRH